MGKVTERFDAQAAEIATLRAEIKELKDKGGGALEEVRLAEAKAELASMLEEVRKERGLKDDGEPKKPVGDETLRAEGFSLSNFLFEW